MFKLGLCSVTFRDRTPEEVIELCKRRGLGAIEWGADVHVKPGESADRVHGIASLCREAGIETPSYGSYFDVWEHDPGDFGPVLETAALLGAGTIRVWAGWIGPDEVTGEQLHKIARTSREIAGQAADRGIRVAFEFHDHTPVEGGDNLLRVLDAAGHDNLYTYFQLIHPDRYEWNLENLDKVYHRLLHVHVQANEDGEVFPLEDYEDIWRAVLERLHAKDFGGRLYFEFNRDNSEQTLEHEIALIRQWSP